MCDHGSWIQSSRGFNESFGRDSAPTGYVPQDGTHFSRDSTASFRRDLARTRRHGTGSTNHGIPRHVVRGIEQSRDTTVFLYFRSIFIRRRLLCGCAVPAVLGETQSMISLPMIEQKQYNVTAETLPRRTPRLSDAKQSNQKRLLRSQGCNMLCFEVYMHFLLLRSFFFFKYQVQEHPAYEKTGHLFSNLVPYPLRKKNRTHENKQTCADAKNRTHE